MAGRIRQADVEELKQRVNIADVIGDYVTLKSAGVGSMKGLCPFHDERSPSFHVRPTVGYFHCFGCGESGDVYTFVQKMDHLSFTESIERLAQRINFELHYEEGSGKPNESGNRSRILAANTAAAEFFVAQLATPGAAEGRKFLGERGFDKAAADHFGIGYAPKAWNELRDHLKTKGFTEEEQLQAGLLSQGDKGVYDRFRGRVIWPIRDVTGQTIGFGARKLFDDDQGPKYLNTPETPVYHKQQVLYGLDLAKRDVSKTRRVVVVEGYTDVMAAHLAGITTAVATCGTAFGADHIRIIRRLLMDDDAFRGEVIFTFDGDAAGQKAALRAFSEDQKFVTQTFVAVEPDGLDPCDLRQQKGDLALRDLIAKRVPLFEFAIRTEIKQHKLDSAEGRVNALNATAPLVAQIRDKSLRPEYSRLLAGWLGIEVELVTAAVNQGLKKQPQTNNVATVEEPVANVQWRPNPQEPRLILEREVLKARLQMPSLIANWSEIEDNAFTHPAYSQLSAVIGAHPEKSSIEIEHITDENMLSLFTELNVEPIRADGEVTGHYVESIVARLREVAISRSIAELKSSLQRLNPVENEQEYNAAFAGLVALETTRRGLHDLALRSI